MNVRIALYGVLTMSDKPENTGRKQDGTFKRGVSGNPAGKPCGTRHKATKAALNLLDGESEALTRKAVELALEGNVIALRLCLERIAPAFKAISPTIEFSQPLPKTLTEQARSFVSAVAKGEIPSDTATQMVSALANVAKIEEFEKIKSRLEALERSIREQSK